MVGMGMGTCTGSQSGPRSRTAVVVLEDDHAVVGRLRG